LAGKIANACEAQVMRDIQILARIARRQGMAKTKVFTSFDFDHDEDLRNLLVGQSKNPDTPFELADWSVKEPMTGDW